LFPSATKNSQDLDDCHISSPAHFYALAGPLCQSQGLFTRSQIRASLFNTLFMLQVKRLGGYNLLAQISMTVSALLIPC